MEGGVRECFVPGLLRDSKSYENVRMGIRKHEQGMLNEWSGGGQGFPSRLGLLGDSDNFPRESKAGLGNLFE